MNYQQIQPPDYLRDYIRYFWTLESGADTFPKTFRTIPDGCPGLIFQQSEKGKFYQSNKQLPTIFLFGQYTKHAELSSSGQFNAIGIYFYPNALKSIFGFNADELTNSCLDVNLLPVTHGCHLSEQLLNAPSVVSQIEVLSSYLLLQLHKNNTPENEVMHYAVSQLVRTNGSISLHELQKNLRISERSFERRFKQYVGISPKLFSRICRFQASLNQLRTSNYSKFSDIAFENNYADQSHFIRAFKEFAGFSPYQYQKKSTEIVENLSELIR